MTPQMEHADKQDGDTEEEEEEEGVNPYQAEAEAKARVVQLRDRALNFWHKDEWECIMNMYTNESFFDTLLCWIRPTRDFLSFLHAELRRLHVTRIVSVGCGCGFLEWLIKRACSGIEVIGYEVDRAWWQGRYGVKPFIEHIYIDEVKTRHIPEGSVLMTCYFHSWECWRQYLAEFRGDIVIVIGPHTNNHLTFPEPRHLLADPRFVLESQREIAGGDMIVVLRRDPERWPVPPPPPEPAGGTEELPSVKPPEDKAEQAKRYNEMRRSLVMDRICSAKQSPQTAPPNPKVRQGPALQSTYTTRKPSLSFSLGSFSVASRLKTLGAPAPGGMKRSVSANARLETMGLGPETKPAPRRKKKAPAGGGRGESKGSSARASGTVTPDGQRRIAAGERLAVDAAFGGRPLRESRSVPSLATLQEQGTGDEQEGEEVGEQELGWQGIANGQRRKSGVHQEGKQSTEHTEGRRKTVHGQSQQSGDQADGQGKTAQEQRRQRTGHTVQQRSEDEQEPNGWNAEQDEDRKGTTNGHDQQMTAHERGRQTNDHGQDVKSLARRQTRPQSPPLVTITDLSSERRRSLRRPSWSLRLGSSPSR